HRRLPAGQRMRLIGRDEQRTILILFEVGTTDATGSDLDRDLPRTRRRWIGNPLDPQIAATVPDCRFHHSSSSCLTTLPRCCRAARPPGGRRTAEGWTMAS